VSAMGLAFLICLAVVSQGAAQVISGDLEGTVLDRTGAVTKEFRLCGRDSPVRGG
jgi:hypothetical protein